jgi:hypothetical protein
MPANNNLARRIELELNRKRNSFRKNAHVRIVLPLVAGAMGITEQEILNGTGRKNERVIAIGFCAYYLHYVFRHDMEDVQYMIDRDLWTCYKNSNLIKNLKDHLSSDEPFIVIKKLLDKQIMEAIHNLKKKNKKSKDG